MAVNMTALINQELAKIEKADRAYGKSVDPAMDAFSEAWKMGTQQREYNEKRKAERSDDAMKIMAATAGNYDTNYDNASLDRDIGRLKNYIAKNQGKFDATAIDYYDLTLNKMKDQKALNVDFLQKQEDLPKRVAEINDYLVKRDKDQVWTAENINELKEMQAPLAKFLGDFKAKHGDRLATKSYEDYKLQLDNIKSMDSFLIQSALDDGHLDEQEATSYIINLEQGNTEASDRYKKLEDVKLSSQIKTLTSKMGDQMTEVQMWKDYLHNDGLIPHPNNPDVAVSMKDYIEEQKDFNPAFNADEYERYVQLQVNSKIKAQDISDTQYQKITADGSYVEAVAPNLVEKEIIKKKEPPKKAAISSVSAVQKSAEGLSKKRKDLKKLKQAEKQGGSYLDRALKNLGYSSRAELEEEISTVESDKAKLPAMERAKAELFRSGQIPDKTDKSLNEFINKYPEEWENLVNSKQEDIDIILQYTRPRGHKF